LKERGREVHVTDNALLEQKGFPKIDFSTYAGFHDPELELPAAVTGNGAIDPNLVSLSSNIQHRNVVFDIDPAPRFKELQGAFLRYGADLKPKARFDLSGKLAGWEIEIPPGSGKVTLYPREAIRPRGGAAFSQHTFYWDDHFVSEALANTDPEMALNTALYWLDHQNSNGSWARELDYKGTPYHRETFTKFGQKVYNREYLNPPLSGWTWSQLYAWNPEKVGPLLPRVVHAMERQRSWLLDANNGYAVYDQEKKLAGFKWTNLGSGEDNAPTGLDQFGLESLPKYGRKSQAAPGREKSGLSVALLSQNKMMLDQQAEFLRAMGKFDEAREKQVESDKIKELLRSRYFDKKQGWFVNLEPVGESHWEQDGVVTLGGFWAVAAKAATPDEVKKMIREYLKNPKKFGGPLLPSVPRDNPYYEGGGAYWRGGGWPPQWRMVSRALKEYGFREEAAEFDKLHLEAMTSASNAYVQGDTPQFLIEHLAKKWPPNGIPPGTSHEEIESQVRAEISKYYQEHDQAVAHVSRLNSQKTGPGTVYELYGVRKTADGKEVASYGTEVRHDGTLHETRGGRPAPQQGFVGWGGSVPLTANRSLVQDAVKAYRGPEQGLGDWLFTRLRDPANQVGKNPAFKPLEEYLEKNPKATAGDFKVQLDRLQTPEFSRQLEFFRKGYVEVSPVFDPGEGKTVLRNFSYDGNRYTMKIDRLPNGKVQVTVESPKPIRMQFNRNWTSAGDVKGTDSALGSSEIFEIGGSHSSVILQLSSDS
jgi:hypothetical protein